VSRQGAACLAGRPDFTVVGRTARCSDLPELCLLRHPDALLVEATGPDRNRVEAISTVRARHPETTIVVVYHSLTPAEMVRAYQAGINALVPYTRGLDAVVAALKAHRDGRTGENRRGSPVR
jgi:DNA-binding NarL/FixJ family response regulator